MPQRIMQSAPTIPSVLDISGPMLTLTGPVTFETVSQLEKRLNGTRASAESVELQNVTEVDSSAVAFLLAIKRRHPAVRFENAPSALNALARLYDVADILH